MSKLQGRTSGLPVHGVFDSVQGQSKSKRFAPRCSRAYGRSPICRWSLDILQPKREPIPMGLHLSAQSWAIRHLVIITGHWFSGRKCSYPPLRWTGSVTRNPRCS